MRQEPRIPKEILEDRYRGLFLNRNSVTRAGKNLKMAGDYNERQLRLDKMIRRLIEGVTRHEFDGEDFDHEGSIVEEVEALIHETIIRRVDEWGLAR